MADHLGIGELARRSGLPATTLRYYERIGVLPPVERVAGRRAYSPDVLATLALVRAARRAGLGLDAIRDVVAAGTSPPGDRWRAHAEQRRSAIRAAMAELEAASALLDHLQRCDCADVPACGRRLELDELG